MSGLSRRRPRSTLALAGLVVAASACTPQLPPTAAPGPTGAELRQLPATAAVGQPGDPLPGLSGFATAPPEQALRAIEAAAQRRLVEIGIASWYGPGFAGRPTASGEIFDPEAMTAAHPALPLGVEVVVVNLENGREARLRINDRGPFVGARVIDVSRAAAKALGFYYTGLAEVRVELLTLAGARAG